MDCLDLRGGRRTVTEVATTENQPTLLTEANNVTKGWAAKLGPPTPEDKYDLGRKFLKSQRAELARTYTLAGDGVYEADSATADGSSQRVYFQVSGGAIRLLNDKAEAKRVLGLRKAPAPQRASQPPVRTGIDGVQTRIRPPAPPPVPEPEPEEESATLGNVLQRPCRWV